MKFYQYHLSCLDFRFYTNFLTWMVFILFVFVFMSSSLTIVLEHTHTHTHTHTWTYASGSLGHKCRKEVCATNGQLLCKMQTQGTALVRFDLSLSDW